MDTINTIKRMRRLRANETIRSLVRENHLSRADLIYPMFVHPGDIPKIPVASMPGVYQYSLEVFEEALAELVPLGIPAILLFGLAKNKDENGSEAWADDGAVQQAIRLAKSRYPDLFVIGDVCLCAYTSHGHCGLIERQVEGQEGSRSEEQDGLQDEGKGQAERQDKNVRICNDESVELLAKVAVSQAEAGVDMVAPSDMMDGRVRVIRKALDAAGYQNIPIMSYAAKFASAFYGPFRQAADSAPKFGDRKSYQIDPANGDEALREVLADVEEGADILLVKPAMAYGDIIYRAKQATAMPIAAYSVSGEYAMIRAAAERGFIDEKRVVLEALLGMKRAGASLLITYHAMDVARWLAEDESGK